MPAQFALAKEAVVTFPADREVVFEYLMIMQTCHRICLAAGSLFGFSGIILRIPLRVTVDVPIEHRNERPQSRARAVDRHPFPVDPDESVGPLLIGIN